MNGELEAAADALAARIRESGECRAYEALKAQVMEDETNRTLLREYRKAQTALQMAAVAGREGDEETVRRFASLSDLLYRNDSVAQYLLAELRVQRLAGEVFQRLTKAAGLETELPGL